MLEIDCGLASGFGRIRQIWEKYDFTSLPNRFGHHTYKWKRSGKLIEVLPAWIADMDFVVLPEVRNQQFAYADPVGLWLHLC